VIYVNESKIVIVYQVKVQVSNTEYVHARILKTNMKNKFVQTKRGPKPEKLIALESLRAQKTKESRIVFPATIDESLLLEEPLEGEAPANGEEQVEKAI
jgi:hypothetical protein